MAFFLMLLGGFVFGWGLGPRTAWLALLIPGLLTLAALASGPLSIGSLVLGYVITIVGVLAGLALSAATQRERRA